MPNRHAAFGQVKTRIDKTGFQDENCKETVDILLVIRMY